MFEGGLLLTWDFWSPIPHWNRTSKSIHNPSIHQCSHGVIYIIQQLIRSRSQVFMWNCGTQINSTWVSYFSQHLTLKAKLRQRNVICVLHLLLKRFAVTRSSRIWYKEYSQKFHPLWCCLLRTPIFTESRRLSIILVLLQWSAGMSLKRPASVSTVVCGSKIHMYGQHLYLLLDYPSAKLLKTRWMSLRVIFYVIFSLQCLCPLLFNGFSFLISYHLLTIFICSSSG